MVRTSAVLSSPAATTAKIVPNDADCLAACGQRLREGELVAFPTETVYGLGCHAINKDAVQKVFAAKERPSSDPLIVHILDAAAAFDLWETSADSLAGTTLSRLCSTFWPGPLTLVARAKESHVPDAVMANSAYVGCRSPSHPTARALLQSAQVPIAAPSANKFGHVSPTTADHVFDDLQLEDVWILQDEENPCQVGVESTVAKLEESPSGSLHLTVLRQGAVSADDLRLCLSDLPVSVSQINRSTADNVANVAPGQTVRHYSPHVRSFLVPDTCLHTQLSDKHHQKLRSSVVLDFGQRLISWKNHVLAYRDISPSGESSRAAHVIFDTLRWAEQIDGAQCILFPQLNALATDALMVAVQDRLTRAASGVAIRTLDDL